MRAAEYSLRAPPASRKARAQHAEIKLRYDRAARRKAGGGGVRLGELRRLFRRRGNSEGNIADIIADLGDLQAWSPAELGQVVEMRWIEQRKLGVRTFRCTDRSEGQISEFYRRVKLRRDRREKRKIRATSATARRLSRRARTLLTFLEGRQWIEKPALTEAAAKLRGFGKLDAAARRQAVHRALKELGALVRTDDGHDQHGREIKLVRRNV
jgi:hypothetical protein